MSKRFQTMLAEICMNQRQEHSPVSSPTSGEFGMKEFQTIQAKRFCVTCSVSKSQGDVSALDVVLLGQEIS